MALGAAVVLATLAPSLVHAQTLGTFTWQLQPYCNKVVVTIVQNGGVYTADGFDEQCGAGQHAAVTGGVTPNPDGTIGFGLTIVTAPGGHSLTVDARISPTSLSGPWTDSDGNAGTFVFNGNAGATARPVARSIAPGVSFAINDAIQAPSTTATSLISTQLRVPADGFVKVEISGVYYQSAVTNEQVQCQLQKGGVTPFTGGPPPVIFVRPVVDVLGTAFSGHRIVPVLKADNPASPTAGQTFLLACYNASGGTNVRLRQLFLSATYFPMSYQP